jgi:hypothetical protein
VFESTSLRGEVAESLLAGLRASPSGPRLLWVDGRPPLVTAFELDRRGLRKAKGKPIPLATARDQRILEPADLIAVLNPEDEASLTAHEISSAAVVVLDHVDTRAGSRLHSQLAADDRFALVAFDMASESSYSIFQKTGKAAVGKGNGNAERRPSRSLR